MPRSRQRLKGQSSTTMNRMALKVEGHRKAIASDGAAQAVYSPPVFRGSVERMQFAHQKSGDAPPASSIFCRRSFTSASARCLRSGKGGALDLRIASGDRSADPICTDQVADPALTVNASADQLRVNSSSADAARRGAWEQPESTRQTTRIRARDALLLATVATAVPSGLQAAWDKKST